MRSKIVLSLDIAGVVLVALPFIFGILMSNYDFYMWIISGSYPFSHMGSGPRMLWWSLVCFVVGILFLVSGFLINKILFKEKK